MVQMKSEMLDVDFSASPNVQTKTISGFECAVGPLSNLNPQQGSTQITIRRGKQDIRQWRQLCAAIRGITPRFPGSEGNVAYQVVQLTGSNSTDEQMTAGYYWFNQYLEASSPVKVTRFVLEVPTEIRVVEVPIEFDNLPLP